MDNTAPNAELAALLAKYDANGGVIDYVFLDVPEGLSSSGLHRAAALAGIAVIDKRLEQWAIQNASKKYPIGSFYRLRWEANKLTGERVDFTTFWGSDDVESKKLGKNAWSIPNIDGYKTAFFHPPYPLRGTDGEKLKLFEGINKHLLGDEPGQAEIFSWSTDWSNYFKAGHEWWGAFYWTIRSIGSPYFAVVGVSSTD